jgi:lactobin A/cerein 7B family class IIb bacteriocin
MRNPELTSNMRALTDEELDDVSGGVIAHLTAAVIAGVIAGWDIAPGATVKDAAKALGVEHLF